MNGFDSASRPESLQKSNASAGSEMARHIFYGRVMSVILLLMEFHHESKRCA